MILYVTANRRFCVRTGMQGTYDIVEIQPFTQEDQWPVRGNRDHQPEARNLADEKDRICVQGMNL